MYEYMFTKAVLWRSSIIVFTYVVHVLMYGASKTGKPLTAWGEILQTILVKSAPDLFREKNHFAVWTSFRAFTVYCTLVKFPFSHLILNRFL
jgi:hypothetical protein